MYKKISIIIKSIKNATKKVSHPLQDLKLYANGKGGIEDFF